MRGYSQREAAGETCLPGSLPDGEDCASQMGTRSVPTGARCALSTRPGPRRSLSKLVIAKRG